MATMIRDLKIGGASVEDARPCGLLCLRRAKQRIRQLFTQERVAISAGSFPMDVGATNRASLPHTEKHQCRSMCTANMIKKSSMVSRDGALTKTMSLAGT